MWNGIEKLLLKMKECTIEEYYASFPVMEHWLRDQEKLLSPKKEHRNEIYNLCENLTLELYTYPVWMKVHILSFCMKCSEDKKYTEWLMQEVLDADYEELGEYSKYYLYWQISSSVFDNVKLQSETQERDGMKLYKDIYKAFCEAFRIEEYTYIPIEQRNQNLVFIFISQFLSETHGPTKTVCDRAYYLQHYLGKKAVIINTAMLIPQKGKMPYYNIQQAGYVEKYTKTTCFRFRDEVFEFFQCENHMPDFNTIQQLLQRVQKEKPYCIINVGGGDVCADLCGNIVPEITISTVFSGVSTACGKFQIVGNDLDEKDCALLRILGVKTENVVKTLFTFVFKKQEYHYSRKELGLAEDSFVLLITGWRLGYEVQEDFLQMLEELVLQETSIEIVFMGLFVNYGQIISFYPQVMKKAYYLEYQADALAVTECCDLYVNPRRKGGGTSCAEALFKGLPAVTLPFGDVAATSSEIFWVDDYGEMKERINKYCREKGYYDKMSKLAEERAKALIDSKTHFCEVFHKIEQNPDFR